MKNYSNQLPSFRKVALPRQTGEQGGGESPKGEVVEEICRFSDSYSYII